jgi:hypothetical protein
MNGPRVLLIAAALATAVSCDHSPVVVSLPPPPPEPGVLTLRLTTPKSDDGAIVLDVRGPDVTQVQLADGTMFLLTESVNGVTQRLVAVGDLQSGALVTFHVPDIHAISAYSATAVEVASRDNAIRSSLEGYTLAVVP